MFKIFFFLSLSFCLVVQINSILKDERRKELLKKLMVKLVPEEVVYHNHDKSDSEFIFNEISEEIPIHYQKEKIDVIIRKYDFPENYNIFNSSNITAKVRDQGKCNSSWSFASTTALSYRYQFINNTDIELSPQDAISCLSQTCDNNYYTIDAQMNLIKTGVVTEKCFPYSSDEGGKPEQCHDDIRKCKDDTYEFKKYKAKNMYTTLDFYSDEYFYEMVEIIMDQLVRKGPVVSQIRVYKDFYNIVSEDPDYIYNYDNKSELIGEHDIVIVGYGYSETYDKYYWIIQNSWGEKWHGNGLLNVEFGQIGIEHIAFSEPYIPNEEKNDVYFSLNKFDEQCYLYINITNDTYQNMENTLEIELKNKKSDNSFFYQCSKVTNLNENEHTIKCYMEWNKLYQNEKGEYDLTKYTSLEEENNFILDDKETNFGFNYLGIPFLKPVETNPFYFISGEGSRISFLLVKDKNEKKYFTKIYPSKNADKSLSDCHIFNLEDNKYDLVYCNIQENELDYFKYDIDYSPLYTESLCGAWTSLGTYVYRLNTTKSLKILIENIYQPLSHNITKESQFKIKAKIEGNLEYEHEDISFSLFTFAELDKKNHTKKLNCEFKLKDNSNEEIDIICTMELESDE